MLTKEDIAQFYIDVESLGLKYPVSAISKATEESKGNVSRILNKKMEPGESFLKRFYESFKPAAKNKLYKSVQEEILANLKEVRGYTIAILTEQEAASKVVLGSLERLEGKPEGTLSDYADKLAIKIQESLMRINTGK